MPRIAVIGARGRMGTMLTERLRNAGHEMRGVDVPLDADELRQACADADAALLCVPVTALERVLEALCVHLRPGTILADITSVKEKPLRLMEKFWDGPVIGSHPLFGPNPEGQALRVAITPGRSAREEQILYVENIFQSMGCQTFRTTAKDHDEAMAKIQSMNFITSAAYFAMLSGDESLLPFLTPSFQRRLDAGRKLLTEDGDLFLTLFEANPHCMRTVRQYSALLDLAAGGELGLLVEKARWWWQRT